MFHYRWAREADQLSGAGRIAMSMMPTADDAQLANGTAMVRERMVNRVSFVGSNPRDRAANRRLVPGHAGDPRASLRQPRLPVRPRPAFADFGMWGSSTTPGPTRRPVRSSTRPRQTCSRGFIACSGPEPKATSSRGRSCFHLDAIAPAPGRQALHSSTLANAQAIASGRDEFTVELAGKTCTQKPQKYHAKS